MATLTEMMETQELEDEKLTTLIREEGVEILAQTGGRVKLGKGLIQQARIMEQGPFIQIWLQVDTPSYTDVLILIEPATQWLVESPAPLILAVAVETLPLRHREHLVQEQAIVQTRLSVLNAILNFESTLNGVRKA